MIKKQSLRIHCYANYTNLIKKLLLIFIGISCLSSYSQTECFLGIGGKDDDTIQKVFQLDSIQIEKMKNWSAELKYRNSLLIDQADNLIKRHEESSPEVLKTVAYQYKMLLDSMQSNLRIIDKRMLGVFTDEQYNLYMTLCNQLTISPLYPTVSVNEK